MIIEEYKKKLENWKDEHTNFYNECLHAMKNRKATLGAFMHIYDYAMSELPNLPEQVELGACEDLFMIYHEKRFSDRFRFISFVMILGWRFGTEIQSGIIFDF